MYNVSKSWGNEPKNFKQMKVNIMINLESLASEIEEFFEVSGDDISSVINHGSVLSFSHTSLIMRNFNYEISP